jgi:hypothetical protein
MACVSRTREDVCCIDRRPGGNSSLGPSGPRALSPPSNEPRPGSSPTSAWCVLRLRHRNRAHPPLGERVLPRWVKPSRGTAQELYESSTGHTDTACRSAAAQGALFAAVLRTVGLRAFTALQRRQLLDPSGHRADSVADGGQCRPGPWRQPAGGLVEAVAQPVGDAERQRRERLSGWAPRDDRVGAGRGCPPHDLPGHAEPAQRPGVDCFLQPRQEDVLLVRARPGGAWRLSGGSVVASPDRPERSTRGQPPAR